jgi:transcriptional regulator with XRE-family HTH domain
MSLRGFIPPFARDQAMTKNTQVPNSVTNLRKLWNKKIKPQYTQIEAAKKLGWTQGAISQYLNNITEMNPAAIIKLANFMEVDPHEIDPSITEHLPNTKTITVRHRLDNMSKRLKQKIHYRKATNSFYVEHLADDNMWPGAVFEVCEADEFTDAAHFVVVKKGEKTGWIYPHHSLPPEKHIKTKLAIISVHAGHRRIN